MTLILISSKPRFILSKLNILIYFREKFQNSSTILTYFRIRWGNFRRSQVQKRDLNVAIKYRNFT